MYTMLNMKLCSFIPFYWTVTLFVLYCDKLIAGHTAGQIVQQHHVFSNMRITWPLVEPAGFKLCTCCYLTGVQIS